MGGALHLGGTYKRTYVEASFLGHIFCNLQVCCVCAQVKEVPVVGHTNNTKHFEQLKNDDKNIFHTYFQNLPKSKTGSENVYFLFSDFITPALTLHIDVNSQDKSERPLINRSDSSSVRGQIVCSNLTPNAAVRSVQASAVARSSQGKKQWEATGRPWLAAEEAALRLYCGFWLSHWAPSWRRPQR